MIRSIDVTEIFLKIMLETWPHPACLPIEALIRDCEFKRTRRGGPGGQHRNKVETAIVVTHKPTGIVAQAGERRSQNANREVAVLRLRLSLAVDYRSEFSADLVPSQVLTGRISGKQISISKNHGDFPAILAEAMDWISFDNYQMAPPAERLGCSTSQLIKLIKLNDLARTRVNDFRKQRGLSPLK